MDDLLYEFLAYDFVFNQEVDTTCPSCGESLLTLDTVEETLHCESCASTYVIAPDATLPQSNADDDD